VDARRVDGALALVVGAGGVAAALGYLWTIAVGRLLPPDQYSDFSAAAAVLYFAITAFLPLTQTVAYFVVRGAPGLEAKLMKIALAGGALLVAVGAAAAKPLLVLLVLSIMTTAILAIRRGVQLGEQRFAAYAWNIAAESALRLALAIALVQWRPSAVYAIGSYAASTAIAIRLAGLRPRGSEARLEMDAFLRYLTPMLVYTAIFAAFQNLDVVVAKHFFAAADAGRYGAASFLARGAGMLVMPFCAFALPRLVAAAGDPDEARRRFLRICAAYAALAAAAVAILGGASGWIVRLLFGAPYAAAAPLLLPLGGAIALSGLVYLAAQLPVSRNDFRFLGAYAIGLAVDVALLALHHGGALQTAHAVLAADAVTLLLVLPFLRQSPSPRTPAAASSG